ncbi:aldo/keto reductase [Paenibacillus doosanensis]|uniref:General stress protein 69 n=1 Tax=Paenibacillus konkukensis TaxID=2020716 RepID=A0ABY4RFP2_9BACL|nr:MULTISPECIES: aldo/keto reductase [Paenibacillus]MCS7460596.1 aldo/keto reductase [Paenibacillus doosanensis]UQZ81183.1 General stress protein 69 [Paenibacillus konkukensis]
MEYTVLGRTGIRVSRLGLGGAPLGGDFGATSDKEAVDTVHAALDAGVTFFDTAPLYGRGESERRLGLALQGKRPQAVIATKAVMRGEPYTYDNTIKSVEMSLRRLQTDWIDLIQLHETEATTFEEAREGTLAAFERLKRDGKVRAIGANGRNTDILAQYLRTGLLDTAQTYCRYTLIDHSAREHVFPLAREYGAAVINGSPLNMGVLADTPAPFLQNNPELLEEAGRRMRMLDFLRKPGPHGLVEAAMRFSLTCPDIAVTLTGAASPDIVAQNAAYCDGQGLEEPELLRVLELFAGKPLY